MSEENLSAHPNEHGLLGFPGVKAEHPKVYLRRLWLRVACVGKLSNDESLGTASESDCLRARRGCKQALKNAFEESVHELDD